MECPRGGTLVLNAFMILNDQLIFQMCEVLFVHVSVIYLKLYISHKSDVIFLEKCLIASYLTCV